jgi:spore coat protein U-like protein
MLRLKLAPTISAGVLLAIAGSAHAATKTATFTVSASVASNCVISTNNLNLGAFDGATDLAQSADITVRCTNATPYEVELSTGASGSYGNRTLSNGTATLNYNLYTDAGHTLIWGDGTTGGTSSATGTGTGMALGQTKTHTVHGQLLASANANADLGTYIDTITATIRY